TDFTNMLAQYQMMGARAQQQQLQQRELDRQNQLISLLGGADINSPETINALAKAGYLPESISVMGAQRQAEAQRAAAKAQRATAMYHQGMLGIAQAKLPFEERKLTQEALKEERLAGEAQSKAEKTAYERDAEVLKKHENLAAKIVMAKGKGYDAFHKNLPNELKPLLPPEYNEEALTNFTTQMATVQENLKRAHEFELVDRINPQTGLKEKIAVPKYAPEKGGKPVAGTQGTVQEKFGFMPGPPDSGTVIRTNPVAGTAESLPLTSGIPAPRVQAPPEGKLTPRVDMTAPPGAPANAPEPIPGTPEFNNRRFGREALEAIGFDPKTGEDRVSKLIKQSTSGGMQAIGAGVRGFFGKGTPGAAAIGQIRPIINNLILEKMNGKLGAGISNEDREFFKSILGNLDDA
ncbi:MAG: hypothetical protein EB015_21555, partial [Methylocystaceae bacterium]|nr:hypothetical protein [Methylocystaceae bacterium]